MVEKIAAGTWVEIADVLLKADERAPQVPQDTRQTALEMRVKGFLAVDARLGDEEAQIITAAGRKLQGRLVEVNPAYRHSFGAPIPELLNIGVQLRALLKQIEKDQ
jgi:hypothetical protein